MKANSFFATALKHLENIGYARAASELLQLSDTQLNHAGLSREKIRQGVAGLPWSVREPALAEATPIRPTTIAEQTIDTYGAPTQLAA